MKKSLLIFLLMLSAFTAAWAVTDGVNYEPVNGIKIVNLWIQDRAHTPEVWSNMPYCNTSARTAVLKDGYVYIARSNANTVIQGTDTLSQSVIYKVDATNGELVKELALTLDGEIYGGATLSCNTVGMDNYGHLYMAPFSSNLAAIQPVYMVDKETGELTLMGELDKYAPGANEDAEKVLENDMDKLAEFSKTNNNVDFAGRIVWGEVKDRQGNPVLDKDGKPKLTEVFNFGKHKGLPVADVLHIDPGYYSWILSGDFTYNTKQVLTRIRLREAKLNG